MCNGQFTDRRTVWRYLVECASNCSDETARVVALEGSVSPEMSALLVCRRLFSISCMSASSSEVEEPGSLYRLRYLPARRAARPSLSSRASPTPPLWNGDMTKLHRAFSMIRSNSRVYSNCDQSCWMKWDCSRQSEWRPERLKERLTQLWMSSWDNALINITIGHLHTAAGESRSSAHGLLVKDLRSLSLT